MIGYYDDPYGLDGNPSLVSLQGLNNLTTIGGGLYIMDNPLLVGLDDLENLASITGELRIVYNSSLESLAGLENIDSITETLRIGDWGGWPDNPSCYGNQKLTDLQGLNGLEWIGGDLEIYCNDSLGSLAGLETLTTITGNIRIGCRLYTGPGGNNLLTDISALENIQADSIDDLQIVNNESLSTCAIQSICDYLESPNGVVWIEYNASGCSSQEEVDSACVYVSVVEIPNMIELLVNPNPTNGLTSFGFRVPNSRHVKLKIFDLHGREVATVVDEVMPPGEHTVGFSASELPAGVYIVRLKAAERSDAPTQSVSAVGKLIVVK
jgi:hypothetical protein